MFKGIIKLILFLNSNRYIGEVAWAVSFALLLALIPSGNLIWITILVVALLIRINHGVMILGIILFKLITPLLDPLLDRLGYWVLTMEPLSNMWTTLYDIPLVPLTKFNNTLVMGGLIVGILAFIPTYIVSGIIIRWYREHIQERVVNTKLFKWFRKFPLFNKFKKALSVGQRLR